MASQDPQTREMMSRLALSCSALARAGQVLSTVTDPAASGSALRQAISILEADARSSRLPQIEAAAQECRDVGNDGNSAERVAVCRRLATRLARLASTLATEVQEQTRKTRIQPTAVPAEASAVPLSDTAPEQPAPERPEIPATAIPATAVPVTAPETGAPAPRTARPRIDVVPIRVAATPEEREVVTAALKAGLRFAHVGNGTLIDTRLDLMWWAAVEPSTSHDAAVRSTGQCQLGGYTDWRLPRPEELQHFVAGGGHVFVEGAGGQPMAIWTSETSRRWLFVRQATVVHTATGSMEVVSASRNSVGVLAIRTPARSR